MPSMSGFGGSICQSDQPPQNQAIPPNYIHVMANVYIAIYTVWCFEKACSLFGPGFFFLPFSKRRESSIPPCMTMPL